MKYSQEQNFYWSSFTCLSLYECKLFLIPYYTIFHVTAVGIPLPANFNKQNGAQFDDSDPVSSGDSETHPAEATKLSASEGAADTAVPTGIICYSFGYFMIFQRYL